MRNLFKVIAVIGLLITSSAGAESVIRQGNGSEPATFDQHLATGVPDGNILVNIDGALVAYNEKGVIGPNIAESWTVSEDGKTHTFKIRADAKWSNGDPVVANDYVLSLRRGLTPKTASPYTFLATPIVNAEAITKGSVTDTTQLGIKAVDDHTLEYTLNSITPYFVSLLAHPFFTPIHQPTFEKYGSNFSKPEHRVSCGAYHLTKWVPQERVEISKNPHHWNVANIKIDKVVFFPIESTREEFNRYKTDELDITYQVSSDILDTVKADPVFSKELIVGPYLANYYYGLNTTKPPFKDNLKLRKALSMVVKRELITEKITKRGEVPLYGWIPEHVANYWDRQKVDFADMPFEQRLVEAKKLYKEAGYSDANPLEVTITYNTDDNHKKIAVAIAQMWKSALGVNTKLHNMEFKVFLAERGKKESTQVFRAGWVGDYNDSYSFFELLKTDGGINDVGFANPEYDALLAKASATIDLKERSKVLGQAERILLDNYVILPIYSMTKDRLVKSKIGGLYPNISDVIMYQYLFIKE